MHHDDLRPLTTADLGRVAGLHRRELPHGLFPLLGRGFLRRYHATFLASPHAVALAAPAHGEPAAFLVGTLDQRAHHQWLARHRSLRLVVAGLLGLLTHPRALVLFVRTRVGRYLRALLRMVRPRPARAAPARRAAGDGPVAVLMHVAVDPACRGDGLGRHLTEAMVDRAQQAGADEVRLVTRDRDGAGGFYERLGWSPATRRRNRDGTVVTEYRIPTAVSLRS